MNTTKISFKVKPINSLEEGIKLGNYDSHYDFITDKTVPLKELTDEKEIFLVNFDRTIGETEYKELLEKEGLKPCEPNYLLGLMAQIKEDDMPKELKNKNIVVPSSVFTGGCGFRCFLCVYRGDGYRKLRLTDVDREWIDRWVFLAEALDTKPLSTSSDSLITLTLTQEEYAVLKKVLERALK